MDSLFDIKVGVRMTREEHIENLETIGCDGWTVTTEAYKSLQWAIKALEQEPSGDLISREDVEECKELMTDINGDTVYAVRMSDIRQLSPVNPHLEHGEWISEKVEGKDWKGCKRHYYQPISCSKCHSPNHYKSAYCPNCGAKMESEEV